MFDYLRSPVPELRALFEFARASLSQAEAEADSSSPPVLIVDDLSVLLSLGVSVRAVLDFTHYCQATICSQLQGSVVTLGLQTGYCRDIHGQVEVWWRGTGENVQSQRKIFQYKVYDKERKKDRTPAAQTVKKSVVEEEESPVRSDPIRVSG
ncbi:hypothetical protein AMELA_G00227120 [Ameiurus melas]|uniref:Elongator complex protein 6 n=1 Tax=Ameiurus melas TaxID=219545 RepID=A0A7J6A1T8_AMEME|nr:hypothetical protein AMELA_G00227120 [Ameiurus melas]